jgi:nucleoside phosphorylase
MTDAAAPFTRKGDDDEFSIGFLTALVSSELIGVETVLKREGWDPVPVAPRLSDGGISKWEKTVGSVHVAAYTQAIGRMGQTDSGLETVAFLDRCKPSLVFLTGIAGSLSDDKVHKEDVVVSNSIRYRTQNKLYGETGCDQYRPFDHALPNASVSTDLSRRVEYMLLEKFPAKGTPAAKGRTFNVHFGEVFTWDYVINSARIVKKLNTDFPSSLCVEMEAGGFLAGIERVRTLRGKRPMEGHVVRGISDYASKKDKDTGTRQRASENAATVAVKLAEWMCSPAEISSFARRSAR